MKTKVAFFTYTTLEFGGGVAKYYTEVSRGLSDRFPDLDITIITFNKNNLDKILFIYYLYFFGKQDRNLRNKEKLSTIKKQLGKVVYRKVGFAELKKELQKYDLIYTTNNLLEVIIFKYLLGYNNLPPVIYGFHIPPFYELTTNIQSKLHNILYSNTFYRQALLGNKIHVINNFDQEYIGKLLSTERSVYKIYNPFNFHVFAQKSHKFRHSFSFSRNKFNILWVGRLTEQKGIDNLEKIIVKINKSKYVTKIIWNIVGDGELKYQIENLASIYPNVNFFGYIENKFIPSIIIQNNIFISTSRWESFPYNLLEAQSLGVPVICFNIHGCNDIIDNGVNGYLVKNTQEFRKTIVGIVKKGNKINRDFIQRYISKKFDINQIYNDMHNLLTR